MTKSSTLSESAVRARFDRRRRPRPLPNRSTEADVRQTAASPAPAPAAAPAPSRPLRRWSVADLVARAAARPSPREPVHC
jgi:hypothetical protein